MKWKRVRPYRSIIIITLIVLGLSMISIIPYALGNQTLTGLIATNLGLLFGLTLIIVHTFTRDWSYVKYISFTNDELFKLLKVGLNGSNKAFIFKVKRKKTYMVFGVGEGFDYFYNDSKLKVSNKSTETKRILDEFIKKHDIESMKGPKRNNMIEPDVVNGRIQKWIAKKDAWIDDAMLVEWRNGNLSWFTSLIVIQIFLTPFVVIFSLLYFLTDINTGSICLSSGLFSVVIGGAVSFMVIVFYTMNPDLYTPRLYSFTEDGVILKLARKGKVVLMDQDHFTRMKMIPILNWLFATYRPPEHDYQSDISFLVRVDRMDNDWIKQIKNRTWK